MELSLETFLIVCPLVFLAGLVDAIGGGGGLISLPAYMIAGVPAHSAVATNKLSSACGTFLATGRFIRNKMVNFRLAVPTVLAAVGGSYLGAKLSSCIDETVLETAMYVVLPVAALIVMNKHLFKDNEETSEVTLREYLVASAAAFVIGCYDGLYGPGTGTFLIIIFKLFTSMSTQMANAQSKVINLTTNITSLVVYISGGLVIFPLGLAAAACNMLGGYLGAGLVMTKGSKIVKPTILLVLLLLVLKILGILDFN